MPALLIKVRAEKDLLALPLDIRDRLIAAIQSLRASPFPHGVQKLQSLEDHYRLRIGEYRVLYTFDPAGQVITIYRVKHRREAYR